MTLNSSGPISLAGSTTGQSIAIELGVSATAQISLNDTNVRTLAGVPSGAIIMPTNFYGKSNRAAPSVTLTTNTTNYSLNITTLSGYVAGVSDVLITVNSGVYVYSTSTANAGMTLTGGTTGDTVKIVNNGFILGMGGKGGGANNIYTVRAYIAGTAGGNAISLGFNTTIDNTNAAAYIAGGGGGGGAYYANFYNTCTGTAAGGGGAGGGAGGNAITGTSPTSPLTPLCHPGGTGGAVGASGGNGTQGGDPQGGCCPGQYYTGGGGGRILPGTGATGVSSAGVGGGAGGAGAGYGIFCSCSGTHYYAGGNGGSANGAGSAGAANTGGGGGWGASGGNGGQTGYAGGKAVALNGKTVTWVSGNTTRVYGAVA